MARKQYLARQSTGGSDDTPLDTLPTDALFTRLERTCAQVNAGRKATAERARLVSELINRRKRAEAPIEDLMRVTGWKRAMVYRVAQESASGLDDTRI